MREGLGEGGTWQSIWDFQIYAASASPLSTLTLLLTLPFLSQVKFDGVPEGTAAPAPPYRITFPASGPTPLPAALSALSRVDGSSVAAAPPNTAVPAAAADSGTTDAAAGSGAATPVPRGVLSVEAYRPQDPGPYPQNQPPQNKVRFTPVQVRSVECDWGQVGVNVVPVNTLTTFGDLASCSLRSILLVSPPPQTPVTSYAPPPGGGGDGRRTARSDDGGGAARYWKDRHSSTGVDRLVFGWMGCRTTSAASLQRRYIVALPELCSSLSPPILMPPLLPSPVLPPRS